MTDHVYDLSDVSSGEEALAGVASALDQVIAVIAIMAWILG